MSAIRDMRLRYKLTQRQVADALGISVPYLSDIENDKRAPLSQERVSGDAVRALWALGFSEEDVNQLLLERAGSAGYILLRGLSRSHDVLGERMSRAWPKLTEEECRQLIVWLNEKSEVTE